MLNLEGRHAEIVIRRDHLSLTCFDCDVLALLKAFGHDAIKSRAGSLPSPCRSRSPVLLTPWANAIVAIEGLKHSMVPLVALLLGLHAIIGCVLVPHALHAGVPHGGDSVPTAVAANDGGRPNVAPADCPCP